jgi:hypothetical protein
MRDKGSSVVIALCVLIVGLLTLVCHDSIPVTLRDSQGHRSIPYQEIPDSSKYEDIAEGRISTIESPFTKRLLYPFVAGHLARTVQIPLSSAFLALNSAALLLLAFCLAASLRKMGANPWFAFFCLLTPLPLEALHSACLPDLCHMALVALFLLLVLYEREKCAFIVLLMAFMTRENTLLLCLFTGGIGLWRRRKNLVYGSLIVLIAGSAFGSWAVRRGLPNTHHWPEFLYLAVRVPHDFLSNVLGIVLQTNVHTVYPPQFIWKIPPGLQMGLDREIQLSFVWHLPVQTLVVFVSLFGCGPLVVSKLLKKSVPFKNWAPPMQIVFAYGLVSYLLGTSLGANTTRLIGYGWPLFWLGLPYLWAKSGLGNRIRDAALLISSSFVVAWIPNFEGLRDSPDIFKIWLLGIPVLWVVSSVCLNRLMNRSFLSGPKDTATDSHAMVR